MLVTYRDERHISGKLTNTGGTGRLFSRRLFTVMHTPLSRESVDAFRSLGFLVLRQWFEPGSLAAEVDRVIADGSREEMRWGTIRFRYVPMMTSKTPASLALLDRSEALAECLLGGTVLPTRAKCVQYVGETPWHVDSELPLSSLGVLAYLEQTRPGDGALRVIPRSHRQELRETILSPGTAAAAEPGPAVDVATNPGDVVLMDERLLHGSVGGIVRRQWRVDFLRAPQDAQTETVTRRYFDQLYATDGSAPYDAERYPSYGEDWKRSNRPAVARLDSLGVYGLAAKLETRN